VRRATVSHACSIVIDQEHAAGLASAGVDVVELLIRAIDGEKDPRCLLKAFECVATVSTLCPPVGEYPIPLLKHRTSRIAHLICNGVRLTY
jgi:hypothetical protein